MKQAETIAQIQRRTDLDRRTAEIVATDQRRSVESAGQCCDADLGPVMLLWHVTATQPAPKGARKDRIHRYVVMAGTTAGAIALAKEKRYDHVSVDPIL